MDTAELVADWVLGACMVAFVGIASGVLLWDGLAAESGSVHAGGRELWRTRGEIVVGALGLAAALWTALGMLTHAH